MKKHPGMILTAAVAALLLGACGSADTVPESTAAPAVPIPVIPGTLENSTPEQFPVCFFQSLLPLPLLLPNLQPYWYP